MKSCSIVLAAPSRNAAITSPVLPVLFGSSVNVRPKLNRPLPRFVWYCVICRRRISKPKFKECLPMELGQVDARVEGVFDADDRQRARLADAEISCGAEDRNAIGLRTLIGIGTPSFSPSCAPGVAPSCRNPG